MRYRVTTFGFFFLCFLWLSSAAYSQVVETSKGKVEFIGLEQWTIAEIRERLGFTSDDQLHYCAAELIDLGFPDASSQSYDDGAYMVVSVVEPANVDRVQYRPLPAGRVPIPKEWNALVREAEKNYGASFVGSLPAYGKTLRSQTGDMLQEEPWWPLLRQRNTEKDYQLAVRVISEDSVRSKRIVAAGVLMNFAERDEAWHVLMRGVRDQEDWVMGASFLALQSLSRYSPKQVDWLPVAEDVHHILNGTSLFGLLAIGETLVNTDVGRTCAIPFLGRGGGQMLIAYLKANHDREKEMAHSLLVRLRGKDLGYDVGPWIEWIGRL